MAFNFLGFSIKTLVNLKKMKIKFPKIHMKIQSQNKLKNTKSICQMNSNITQKNQISASFKKQVKAEMIAQRTNL